MYCVADGLKLKLQANSDVKEQGKFYNDGWTHGHYVTDLFVFSAYGRIIKQVLNMPARSVQDSNLCHWGNVYDELEDIYKKTGGKCCIDFAFKCTGNSFLIKSSQDVNDAANAAREQ